MRFPHRRRREPPDSGEGPHPPGDWRDSGVGAEVEAFLAGRMVDHLPASPLTVPGWLALNRLAHAQRGEIVRVIEGAGIEWSDRVPGIRRPWASAERFVAGHVLAAAPTVDDLGHLQREVLIPLELELIERGATERLTPDQVLSAARDAVDHYRSGV